MKEDLNDCRINDEGLGEPLKDYGVVTENAECVFKNLSRRLCAEIERYPYVAGCVAWLTNKQIIESIAFREGASIILQKEDFLRPDYEHKPGFEADLRHRYNGVEPLVRGRFQGLLSSMSMCSDLEIGIRCVGNRVDRFKRAGARSHHKFLVFMSTEPTRDGWVYSPRAVWTGSFNFTRNAELSFENAVIIRDERIAKAYLDEYQQVAALSEPLDWDVPYVAPEWRIGT